MKSYYFCSIKQCGNYDVGILTKMNADGSIMWSSIALIEYNNDPSDLLLNFKVVEKDFNDIQHACSKLYTLVR